MDAVKVVHSDVLVVGAGGAGLAAALSAAETGAKVVLVDKSKVGYGGATVMGLCQICAALGQSEPDSWTEHYEDTIKGGHNINNPALVEVLAKEAPGALLWMDEIGVKWDKIDGVIEQNPGPGHSKARAAHVNFHTGRAMINALVKGIYRSKIETIDNVVISKLLKDGNKVIGAIGYDFYHGQPIAFRFSAVVLATGGGMDVYPVSTASSTLTGVGYGLALDAGADLIDMEFVQFLPTCTLFPKLPGISVAIWAPVRYFLGGELRNGKNEDFMPSYGSGVLGTRDVISYAIASEVKAGRGTPHGGAYLDFSGVGKETIEAKLGSLYTKIVEAGLDISRNPVEVGPMPHHFMGGIRIGTDCSTSVSGLFAAGEVAGGVHGANRLSGNALSDVIVFGRIAGSSASCYQDTSVSEPEFKNIFQKELSAMLEKVEKQGTVGVLSVKSKLQQAMMENAGPIRNAASLKKGLELLEEIEAIDLPLVGPTERHSQWDIEVADLLELPHMLKVGRSIIKSAIARTESRGAHFREDYPEKSPDWVTSIRVVERDGLKTEILSGKELDTP